MAQRTFQTFIGIDLGGARGKSTAVARLASGVHDGDTMPKTARVEEVLVRSDSPSSPWTDDTLLAFLSTFEPADTAIAINAPLTAPACVRCELSVCPSYEGCVDPATVWLRTTGQKLQRQAVLSDRDRIASIPQGSGFQVPTPIPVAASQRLPPYTHRCTEVELHYTRGLLPREQLGQASWAIASRAAHIRRALAGLGFGLNEQLIEVSPRCTIQALFGAHNARGYKRDADPWRTRAWIVEQMHDVAFGPKSGLSREGVLQNDNCFDALISAYTAFLWARDGWTMPKGEPFDEDGWIWAPP